MRGNNSTEIHEQQALVDWMGWIGCDTQLKATIVSAAPMPVMPVAAATSILPALGNAHMATTFSAAA